MFLHSTILWTENIVDVVLMFKNVFWNTHFIGNITENNKQVANEELQMKQGLEVGQ